MVPTLGVSHNLGEVCRLKKTLYGLKQAPSMRLVCKVP